MVQLGLLRCRQGGPWNANKTWILLRDSGGGKQSQVCSDGILLGVDWVRRTLQVNQQCFLLVFSGLSSWSPVVLAL